VQPVPHLHVSRLQQQSCTTLALHAGLACCPPGALQEAEKRRIALTPASAYRGWQRLGSNVTQGRRDLHEGIDLYKACRVVGGVEAAAALWRRQLGWLRGVMCHGMV
jgi:hypothetical protein